jgi:general secretion pathway protein J
VSRGRCDRGRTAERGFTLVELLIATAVLAGVALLIFGAFSGMKASKEGLQRVSDRYREGRLAMARISRELQSAYLSRHAPIDLSIVVQQTAFIATPGSPADRVDFNCFCNRRLDRHSNVSDQAEVSFFGSPDPEQAGVVDLARRVSPRLDLEPDRGGIVQVLATDIDLFDLEYLDPETGMWTEEWDSTQAVGQPDRLPLQVRAILVLNGGERSGPGQARQPLRFVSKIPIHIMRPLTFATQ